MQIPYVGARERQRPLGKRAVKRALMETLDKRGGGMNSGESLEPWEALPLMDTETDVCFAKDITSEALQLTAEDRLGMPELSYAIGYRR
ncbi:hypothetical protein TNCT_204381 [Trichonephila clavata]|uniref:Uncharacterized protein n=1 Tax=Trichonephila clavata TaxID=2740835 RepID=A0A8X6LUG4_TRICU|nr:hypothetical protein TNCT_204381 [Trichonephila clavata]